MSRFNGARSREDYLGTTSQGVGSVPAAIAPYVVAEEFGDCFRHVTELTLNALPVTVGNATGIDFGSKELYDFPETRFLLEGGNLDAQIDSSTSADHIGDTGSGDASLGTTATADATLGGTDVDLMASTPMLDPFVAGIGTLSGSLVKTTEFDGSGTAKKMYLNLIFDDADVADGDSSIVYVTGTIVFAWTNYGDRRTF